MGDEIVETGEYPDEQWYDSRLSSAYSQQLFRARRYRHISAEYPVFSRGKRNQKEHE